MKNVPNLRKNSQSFKINRYLKRCQLKQSFLIKIGILKRVGSILVPRDVFRLINQIIGCTFIVKIVVISV
jgi:hypothetical protein